MKKFLLSILLTIMAIFLVSCNENNIIYVGTNAEFPPFEYFDKDKIVGFDIDLINEVGNILNKEIKVIHMDFDGLLPALQSKKVDMVIAGMTETEERKENVNFSNSYYEAKQVIIINEDNNYIKSFEDLENKNVGVVLGFTGDALMTEKDNSILKRFSNVYSAVLDLKNGKIEAIVLDSEPAKNIIKNNEGIKVVNTDSLKESYAIAFRKDDENLMLEINNALKKLGENGKYKELIDKYFN
ncbi:MAG: arginine/lysine/histidine transporter system substrate-binding protein [Oceanotoga sp.]|uniref:Amino acid ABC transporter substrate-binding protein (PAAT family) n=1 Tax=Oceanotoga teriensis TaxID=515440 RepID=A0AA45C8U4_9BACT|nr:MULTISPECIES: basic amino acid ABC transporter substrate-binding protein [Oceanotoga]MDN5342713.1 arginine/lysine/histidine transporter system substrate-binding protein [Oceanotoga sp.]PWJ96447.1 amino acid ABC transporter substrate-binding protein (PAAT family) [Oceanotoga teriensis]